MLLKFGNTYMAREEWHVSAVYKELQDKDNTFPWNIKFTRELSVT